MIMLYSVINISCYLCNIYNVYQKVHNLPIINSASIIIFESYINNITINQSCLYDIMYILTVLFKFHVN